MRRALAMIATATNPADNCWRAGNMLATISLDGVLIQ
jgi:hypothetical protein